MDYLSRLKALLPGLVRVELLPSAHDRSLALIVVLPSGPVLLSTNDAGDGLYFDPIYTNAEPGNFERSVCVYEPRAFSVHKYDMSTDAGRRAARSYVRRKLLALIESDSDISSSAEKSDTVSVLHDSTLTSVSAGTLRIRGFKNSQPDASATEGDRGDVAPGNQCWGTQSPALRDYEPL